MLRLFRAVAPFALVAALLAGCLPGHQRTSARELFPTDSLSRQLAETTDEQSLEVVWRTELPAEVRYPVSLVWEGPRVIVADLQRASLHSLTDRGQYVGAFTDAALEYPLIAGAAGDTVAVLSRGHGAIRLVLIRPDGSGELATTVPVPAGQNAQAAWSGGRFFTKIADNERGSAIFEVAPSGRVLAEYPLAEGFWRHVGFLRPWGEAVVSLGGYRPVVRAIDRNSPSGTRPDSLFLMGFDSPQLERSRLFVLGEIREPPLLVPSAAAAGEHLFVLNARPGWAHVDVFRREETELVLTASLLSPEPELGRSYFAADLAVKSFENGFDLLVLETRPRPAVVRYRWRRR